MSVAIGLALVSGLLLLTRRRESAEPTIAALAAGASREARRVEARLSGGFPWAPYRSGNRSGVEADAQREFSPVVAMTLAKVHRQTSATARHTGGIAHLLDGRSREALGSLTAAAERLDEPAVWSDLAAARLEGARRHEAPEFLAEALAAADRALALDPRHAEGLFNRAVILERLGLRDDAREAWTLYLTTDGSSEWADEARERLKALAPVRPFLEQLDREYDRLAADPAAAVTLVQVDAFGVRGMGVMEVLGRWGHALLRDDTGAADHHLAVARHLGRAVARGGGDRMLERTVATIESADSAARRRLAAGHATYHAGLKALQTSKPVEAEALLRRSATVFERESSPMALPARYFAANALFEQGQQWTAQREIEVLLRQVPKEFPAYRAMLEWQLGICHASRAEWGSAIRLLETSASMFDRLDEPQNAAAVRRLLAFAHDRIGDPATAWKHRLSALVGLGRVSNLGLEKAVSSIADAAILRRQWAVAASFLNLETRIAARLDDDVQLAVTLLSRAVVHDRLQNVSAAATDIVDAGKAHGRVEDPSYREYLQLAERRAVAMLSRTPPAEAEMLLTEVIKVQSARSTLMLPGLFLERARVRRQLDDLVGATDDLEAGMAELERHRESLPQGEARWGAFHSAEELFDEAIDLAIDRGDPTTAFRTFERSRGRALLDAWERAPRGGELKVPARTLIIGYAALPSRLVIFTADFAGVEAVAVRGDRQAIVGEIEAFTQSLRKGEAPASRQASAVYRRLIEPVASRLRGRDTLVFVPDATTATVPFSALSLPGGEYLLERHAIVVAPSAAVFEAASARRASSAAPRSVLIVSSSMPAAGSSAIGAVRTEASRIARSYERVTRVHDEGAELAELARLSPGADVIHFAGHAVGDGSGLEPASILLWNEGKEHRVRVADLAALRLRRSAVVVLAGCSTAQGERRAAEGVISVAHGFMTAGAPSVVATLWPIEDDAAAAFFPRLHEKLARGMSPAAALRELQLEVIRGGDVPVSLWAAVQNVGS